MASAAEHYERLLGAVYSWMIGDFAAATQAAETELLAAGIEPAPRTTFVDLGCGPGAHAVAAAKRGAETIAIDACDALLAELRDRATGLPLTVVGDEIGGFRRRLAHGADAIVCMGDTLTHLADREAVTSLISEVAAALNPGGAFLATFRDYSGPGPEGTKRFIPVRSDERRIMTCFLEYGETKVTVTDLVHERTENGWELKTSNYEKLRLAPAAVAATLEEEGLAAEVGSGPRGMTRIVARKPR